MPRRHRRAASRRRRTEPGSGTAARPGQRRRAGGTANFERLLRQDRDDEHRLEAAAAGLQRIDADHLGQHHLPERRDRHRTPASLELWAIDRNKQAVAVEAAARRRQPHGAQAEHVVAVAGHRRQARLGDDRRRHAQGVRLRRQGNLVARPPDRLRQVRAATGATPRRRCCTATRSTCRSCTA